MPRLIQLAAALLALLCVAPAARAGAAPTDFGTALAHAQASPATPFSLQVECTEAEGRRTLSLYPTGALIWNGRRQARLDAATRGAMLQALQDAGFAHFADRYGGKPEARQSGAPIMVLCHITATVDGVVKSSYQDANGKRSEAFMALASTLLNLAGPLGEGGVEVATLEDGIAALAAGSLAPEALTLRLLRVPADKAAPGDLLEVSDGELRRKAYRPGVEAGDWRITTLDTQGLQTVTTLLTAADAAHLPRRVAAPDTIQLELRVLQHALSVRARPGVAAAPPDPDAERLLRLVDALLALP